MRHLLEVLAKELPQQAGWPVQPNPKIRYTVVERVFQGQIQSQVCHSGFDPRTSRPQATERGRGQRTLR